jgi:hypothetical protein
MSSTLGVELVEEPTRRRKRPSWVLLRGRRSEKSGFCYIALTAITRITRAAFEIIERKRRGHTHTPHSNAATYWSGYRRCVRAEHGRAFNPQVPALPVKGQVK